MTGSGLSKLGSLHVLTHQMRQWSWSKSFPESRQKQHAFIGRHHKLGARITHVSSCSKMAVNAKVSSAQRILAVDEIW
jgi:hypothetical protein